MAENKKPAYVEVWMYNGKEIPIKSVSAKVYGGIVVHKDFDPLYPVIWLGQKSYRIVNPRNKKNILFYDTLAKCLFKPSAMSELEDNIDMVTQMSQNMMLGGQSAKETMGMNEASSNIKLVAIAGMIICLVMVLVFMYLLWQHAPTPAGTTTTIYQAAQNATTTVLSHPLGPQIVPTGT